MVIPPEQAPEMLIFSDPVICLMTSVHWIKLSTYSDRPQSLCSLVGLRQEIMKVWKPSFSKN